MQPHEPTNKTDRRFAWSALVVTITGAAVLAFAFNQSFVSLPGPIVLGLIPRTALAGLSFVVACFDDLSKRRFRDSNTKMHWTVAISCCSPMLLVYLFYFGFVLPRRERLRHDRAR